MTRDEELSFPQLVGGAFHERKHALLKFFERYYLERLLETYGDDFDFLVRVSGLQAIQIVGLLVEHKLNLPDADPKERKKTCSCKPNSR